MAEIYKDFSLGEVFYKWITRVIKNKKIGLAENADFTSFVSLIKLKTTINPKKARSCKSF
jgi:hypothetical protein